MSTTTKGNCISNKKWNFVFRVWN